MTPTQLEAAARELCRMRGIDPDADLGLGKPWELVRLEVKRFAQIGTAIAAAMQAPPRKRITKKK